MQSYSSQLDSALGYVNNIPSSASLVKPNASFLWPDITCKPPFPVVKLPFNGLVCLGGVLLELLPLDSYRWRLVMRPPALTSMAARPADPELRCLHHHHLLLLQARNSLTVHLITVCHCA